VAVNCWLLVAYLHPYIYLVGVYSVLNIKYMVSDHALLRSYPTTDSNTSTGMMWVTLNMPSATEDCRKPFRNCQGISHCLESGRPAWDLFVYCALSWWGLNTGNIQHMLAACLSNWLGCCARVVVMGSTVNHSFPFFFLYCVLLHVCVSWTGQPRNSIFIRIV